ncbi:MAG: cell division protein FtsZ [Candidatus Diapherotrites archaeon]|uniref:Cell division protein FtsZ n=1 Tax=Candidatus Iainarchaeum sp. TaxID=3101447 RepID=A0A8T3YJY5_9ARCH|nr:cell division protein FtsZ [Candidatus Diapherotrites archaeon]
MKSVVSKALRMAKDESLKARPGGQEGSGARKKGSDDDEELANLLEASKAKIRVVGCGGGGCNTINRMTEVGILGAETIAVNTDAQDLLKVKADRKVLIGRKLTRGLGAGSDPSVGEASAQESMEDLSEVLSDSDLVFITCGMGGGTGTGSAPVVAELVKHKKALTIGVVTLPFSVEGKKRIENAMNGLSNLRQHADTVIVIPNDKILEIAPDLPINAAFKVADEVLTNAVKGITEMITKPGLINLDFADLRTILDRGGAAMIGLGESSTQGGSSDSRALEAVENALTSPLLDVDISNAGRALINVVGGSDMTLREAEMIVEAVSSKISSNAHIIWGAMIDDSVPKNQIQAMVVIAGGRFPYLDDDGKPSGPVDLGIQFAD